MRHGSIFRVLTALLVVVFVQATASAAPLVWDFQAMEWAGTGSNSVAIASISAEGVLVGDKLFTDFNVQRNREGNATAPTAAGVSLSGVFVGGDYGLKFTGNWQAFGDSSAESTILFKVTATDPGLFVKDNGLALGSFGAWTPNPLFSPPAGVAITENVYVFNPDFGPILGGVNVANKFVFYENPSNQNTVTSADFYLTPSQLAQILALPPAQQPNFLLLPDSNPNDNLLPVGLKSAWILKNIGVSGSEVGGAAHLSVFYQTFSQVPEPASMLLLGMGAALIAFPRRKRLAA